jgi:hypothetical protein
MQISVGSCFAFAIGKVTSRMETSIFDETLDKTVNSLAGALEGVKDISKIEASQGANRNQDVSLPDIIYPGQQTHQ